MIPLTAVIEGAQCLRPDGLGDAPLCMADGKICEMADGKTVDLSDFLVLPGIVDVHGDGFERHVAPRRGAMNERTEGLFATEAELAANGITTAYLAQFYSWEGGLRGPDFADSVFRALRKVRAKTVTDMRGQLRFEIHLLDDYDALPDKISDWGVEYVVFNDHLPHKHISAGKRPPRLTAQALKAARNPDDHWALLLELKAREGDVPQALDRLLPQLRAQGIRLGSHDDPTPEARAAWRARGVGIAEFPETIEAAEAARANGEGIVLGAPNLVRGGSHKGNASALDLVGMGLVDALASDYHYPSPRRAALMLHKTGVLPLEAAWRLISDGPARLLGLSDRGRLEPGLRADLVILDAQTHRVAATLAGGRFSYLSGEIANRFFA